mmetsp:Transcript_2377/g.4775  ORF Transcript_2377/g.4775 Transcript_2377/m.4775 type:complete len:88 (+) Transcript_2377:206-469(+)
MVVRIGGLGLWGSGKYAISTKEQRTMRKTTCRHLKHESHDVFASEELHLEPRGANVRRKHKQTIPGPHWIPSEACEWCLRTTIHGRK